MVDLKRIARGDLRILDRGPTLYVWSSFAHYGVRALLMPRVRRDKEFVTNEYNNDRDEYWKPTLSEDEFIYGDAQTPIWVLIDDKLSRATLRDVRTHVLPRLRDRIASYSKAGDLIVEFGAGTGRNLAYLARALPDRRYLGLELTPRTVEEAKRTLAAYNLSVEMQIADVTQPIQLETKAAVAFSVLALEQLPGTLSRDALKQMAASANNAIICLEPIRELFPRSVRGLASRFRQYRVDYLKGLPGHARELGLRVVVEQRTGLAHNPMNETCELVIEL
jgi:SAM-dependent methyltransferase